MSEEKFVLDHRHLAAAGEMKKDKEKAKSSSPAWKSPNRGSPNGSGEEHGGDSQGSDGGDFSLPAPRFSARNASSKYDFVKVKVWLGDNCDHYYVLSRFLLSRMLTVTKIPNHVAIKIALELKKLLIDNSLLDVSQSDLEANLFKLMERRAYGEEYINRYKMMTRFHHQRVPLVILVCGTACVGKSTIATQLAQRLNLPNVLQTDMVYELLRTSTEYAIIYHYIFLLFVMLSVMKIYHNELESHAQFTISAPLASIPVWARDYSSSEELITEFCRECRIVRKGLAGDLKKAMKDGKPIIIEGIHLDPSIYLMDDENKLPADDSAKSKEAKSLPVTSDGYTATQMENNPSSTCNSHDGNSNSSLGQANSEEFYGDQLPKISASLESMHLAGKVNECPNVKDAEDNRTMVTGKEKSGAKPIIVPIVLKMAEFDHKALLEEWISTRTFSGKCLIEDKDRLIGNLKTIQDYLCSFEAQGLTVVNISATTFPQTLDYLHNHLLQSIEQGISSSSSNSGRPFMEK